MVRGACPNLLYEASLYRYGDGDGERRAEVPVDEHNHALAALRYLVSKVDARQMARFRRRGPTVAATGEGDGQTARVGPKPWLRLDNEELWRRVS